MNSPKFKLDLYSVADINKLLDNEFVFSRKYDMEQCLTPVKMNPIDWEHIPFEDPEWTWVFHRMEYCVDLCYETLQTNDLKYINHATSLIFDFITNATKSNTLRTLDSAIRIISWLKYRKIALSLNILNASQLATIDDSISAQITTLYNGYRPTDSISNWGAIQAIAVLNAAGYIEIKQSIIDFFANEFNSHLNQQFYSDGMQWEQSSVYIVEVTLKLLQMNNPQYQSSKYTETLETVFFALYSICDNNYYTIAIGDGDIINVEAILQMIAVVTNKPDLLAYLQSEQVYAEVYYLYGEQALDFFQANTALLGTSNCYLNLLDKSGLLAYKTSQLYLSFQNGPIGGGHGHSDNLHLNLTIKDQPLLVDSGRFSYVNSYERRQYFKDSTAHNGFIFDHELVEYHNSWRSFSNYHYSPIKYTNYEHFLYAQASITSRDNFGQRELLCFPNGDLLVLNSSFTEFKVNYIIDDSISPTADDTIISLGDYKLYTPIGNHTIEPCYISKHYNTKTQSSKLTCTSESDLLVSFVCNQLSTISVIDDFTYIYGIEQHSADDNLRGFKIETDDNLYIIFYNPFENAINNSSIKYQGQIFTGKLVVYNQTTEQIVVIRN